MPHNSQLNGVIPGQYKWLPAIDTELCTGCGQCVDACGPRSLNVVDGVAALVDPATCGSEEHCIGVCPEDAIKMHWCFGTGDRSIGLWKTAPDRGVHDD